MTKDLDEKLEKLKKLVDKYYYVMQAIIFLTIVGLLVFSVINWHSFQKNACQICEDSGRKCYEKNEPEYQFPESFGNIERIDYPENLKT